jgi:hypothetical protein
MKRISLLFMLLTAIAFGQEFRATITGRVTDSSGAVIPKAAIVVTNTNTGVRTNTISDKSGSYTVPFLLPGTYSITVTVNGFQTYLHDGIKLQTGDKITEDVPLTIGSTSEKIYVSADAPLIQTATATAGQVLTTEEVENLPSNGRSPLGFAKTEYGVVPKAKNLIVQNRPFDNSSSSDFSIGGGNSQSNELLLNGVPNMQDSSRVSGFSPQLDSVDEVRVDVFEADASYGDTSGGTVNLTTKAGTNAYHGTLSEFNEFSAINAPNRWFVAPGVTQPVTRQNQYGWTIGGPVWIPKLYNGRDKFFFFYSYERFLGSEPNPMTTSVPTAAERNGDFSALLALGSSYQLADPATATLSGKNVVRKPFAGNIIPTPRINGVAKGYLQYIPLPNVTGSADGENNFFSNIPTGRDYNSHSGRLDYNVSSRNKIFFETHRSEYTLTQSNIFNNIATGSKSYTVYQGGLLDDIHTFSPSLTLDTRLSLTRTYSNGSLPSQGFDATTLGFPTYINTSASTRFLPAITFKEPKGTTLYQPLSQKPVGLATFDTIQLFAALTKVTGHHTLKIGPDIRQSKLNQLSPQYASGLFTFDSTWVSGSSNGIQIPFGSTLASFLLGLPTVGSQNTNVALTNNQWYFGGFIQDDWRVFSHLTLNMGLRLEHETPIVESNNRAVVRFDQNAVNAATTAATAAYATSPFPELPVSSFKATGGVNFATSSQRSEYNTPTMYVSPRFGFSFSPPAFNDKMVIRGGFGLFVNPFNDYNTPPSYGYSAATNLVPTADNYLTPAATLSDPFPAINPIQQPSGSALGINTNLGGDIQFRGPKVQVPYSERWNFDIQQQLSKNMMIDIGYIGNHQVHLSYSNNLSAVPLVPFLSRSHRQDLVVGTNLGQKVNNPFYGLISTGIGVQKTVAKSVLLQGFPEYNTMTQALVPGASATFNELLVRVQKRMSHGLTLNVNYEYSKNLITGQLTPGGPLTYQTSSSDYPHHIAVTGTYRLPLGQGGAFFHDSKLIDVLVGGFTVNTIYQYLSGSPIQWSSNVDFANGSNGFNSNFQQSPRNIARAFNTDPFYQGTGSNIASDPTDTGQPNGNNYRTFPQYFLRQDSTNDLDASVLKDFHFGERFRLQYRFEAFNVLNHTSFGTPNVSPTSSAFGTIKSVANVPRTLQQGLRVVF